MGLCYEQVSVQSSTNIAPVRASAAAGGIIGLTDGPCDISDCISIGKIRVDAWGCGGIIGDQHGGTLTGCYSGGTVFGYELLGGIAGRFYNGAIMNNCFTETTITHNHGDAIHDYNGLFTPYGDAEIHANNYWISEKGNRSLAEDYGTVLSEAEFEAQLPEQFQNAHAITQEKFPH